jgi:hypothetical protein
MKMGKEMMKMNKKSKLKILKGNYHVNDISDWINFCHLTPKRVDQDDVKFKTLENSKLAEDHIVICGMVENIRHVVWPLRALHIKKISPIVILHHEKPSAK